MIASIILCYLQLIGLAYVVIVLMGAPFLTDIVRTLVLSTYIVLIGFTPIVVRYQGKVNDIYQLLMSKSNSNFLMRNLAWGTMFGAWLGAIPIPLDWDRWWQRWPITCLVSSTMGAGLSVILSYVWLRMHTFDMAKLTASQEQELRGAFDLFDSDHSGRISRMELKRVLQALNIKVSDNELQQLMIQMDSDNSGEIDYNEFKKVISASFFRKYSKQELQAAFKKFDTDNSGYITAHELSHILSRMGRHISQNEVEAMVKSLDASGDGKISFEEFCKLFD
ncbi:unnamed protein product [Adineta ricciae]|uniref:EF-hand domain-containing protein n=1 Tax=Adineta ricciae TaxID=249248 RepID=A0A815W082_ADIRI|nr:unnamed protein product [Adineta ricciae]